MSNDMKQILKRIIVLFAAIAVVGWIGLRGAQDRTLKATEMTQDDALAQASSALSEETEYAPAEETVQLEIPQAEEAVGEDALISEELPEEIIEGNSSYSEIPSSESSYTESMSVEITDEGNADGGNTYEEIPYEEALPDEEAQNLYPDELSESSAVSGGSQEQDVTAASSSVETDSESLTEEEKKERKEELLRTITEDGTEIIVSDPENTLPEGAYVTAEILPAQTAQGSIDDAIGSGREITQMAVYDIIIHGPDGVEIQPESSVRISIKGAFSGSSDEKSVYRIEDSGKAEKVADITEEGEAEFEAAGS